MAKPYYRLPKNLIQNDLYEIKRTFDRFYSKVSKGDDVNIVEFDQIIKDLTSLRKAAKSFTSFDQIDGTVYEETNMNVKELIERVVEGGDPRIVMERVDTKSVFGALSSADTDPWEVTKALEQYAKEGADAFSDEPRIQQSYKQAEKLAKDLGALWSRISNQR